MTTNLYCVQTLPPGRLSEKRWFDNEAAALRMEAHLRSAETPHMPVYAVTFGLTVREAS